MIVACFRDFALMDNRSCIFSDSSAYGLLNDAIFLPYYCVRPIHALNLYQLNKNMGLFRQAKFEYLWLFGSRSEFIIDVRRENTNLLTYKKIDAATFLREKIAMLDEYSKQLTAMGKSLPRYVIVLPPVLDPIYLNHLFGEVQVSDGLIAELQNEAIDALISMKKIRDTNTAYSANVNILWINDLLPKDLRQEHVLQQIECTGERSLYTFPSPSPFLSTSGPNKAVTAGKEVIDNFIRILKSSFPLEEISNVRFGSPTTIGSLNTAWNQDSVPSRCFRFPQTLRFDDGISDVTSVNMTTPTDSVREFPHYSPESPIASPSAQSFADRYPFGDV